MLAKVTSFAGGIAGSILATTIAAHAVEASSPASSPNGTALEPYLVTWLLPVSGLISVIIATIVDRRVRNGLQFK